MSSSAVMRKGIFWECGMRSAECGMRNAECGMRNAEYAHHLAMRLVFVAGSLTYHTISFNNSSSLVPATNSKSMAK